MTARAARLRAMLPPRIFTRIFARIFAPAAPGGGWVLAAVLAHAAVTAALLALAAAGLAPPIRVAVIAALAIGACWGANTFSHIHLHTPLFRYAGANRALTLLLTATLGIPQSGWKRRHLRHHGLPAAGSGSSRGARGAEVVELVWLAGVWLAVGLMVPGLLLGVYLPAWLLGLALCAVQGHYEHAGAAPAVDCHHRLYNRLWFNDGYHGQHHLTPSAPWTTLAAPGPLRRDAGVPVSPWPPLLRWMEPLIAVARALPAATLDRLERLPIASPRVRAFMLRSHQRALGAVLRDADRASIRRVCIIGGGLFPRTALVLRRLLPEAALAIVDADATHVATARRLLGDGDGARPGGAVTFHVARYDPAAPPACAAGSDLLVVPLAYRGDRGRFYAAPPAPLVIVHDWLWRRRGDDGRSVSPWLLKRLNLVRARAPASAAGRPFDTLSEPHARQDRSPWPQPVPPPQPPTPVPALTPVPAPEPSRASRSCPIAPSSSAFAAAIARRS